MRPDWLALHAASSYSLRPPFPVGNAQQGPARTGRLYCLCASPGSVGLSTAPGALTTAHRLRELEGLRRDVVELVEDDAFAGRALRMPEAGERVAEVLAAIARAPDRREVVIEVAERRDDVERRQDLPRQRIVDVTVPHAFEHQAQAALAVAVGAMATN
jgi:hypothetical protein